VKPNSIRWREGVFMDELECELICEYPISYGGDFFTGNPLSAALRFRNEAIVRLLLRKGANPFLGRIHKSMFKCAARNNMLNEFLG
jgi:hypothetical protein